MKRATQAIVFAVPGQLPLAAASVFLSCVVVAFLGLIGLGRWQLDEYVDFYRMRSGLPYVLERLRWSPRPISEPLYYLYGWLVNTLHRPLILPFLAAFWTLFLFAGGFTFRQTLREHRSQRAWNQLLIALTLMALFLAGGHLSEVFYWPAGTVAYLPTLSATLLLFLQILDGKLSTPRGRLTGAICLTIAAGSSEAGATFALCYILMRGARRGLAFIRSRQSAGERAPLFWLTVPAIMAALVLMAVRMNRFRAAEAPTLVRHSIAGHPLLSLIAGFEEMVIEFIGRGMLARTAKQYPHPATWFHLGPRFLLQMLLGSRIPMEILLVLGVGLWYSRFERPSRELSASIIEICGAFMAASLFTIAAANLHFGVTCCDRHEVLRECWTVMTMTGLVILFAGRFSGSTGAALDLGRTSAPLLLCVAVYSLGFMRPLIRTYHIYKPVYAASGENFASGFRATTDPMNFWVVPSAGIISEEILSPGVFAKGSHDVSGFGYDVYPYYLMDFFRKDKITIQPLRIDSAFYGIPLHVESCDCGHSEWATTRFNSAGSLPLLGMYNSAFGEKMRVPPAPLRGPDITPH